MYIKYNNNLHNILKIYSTINFKEYYPNHIILEAPKPFDSRHIITVSVAILLSVYKY